MEALIETVGRVEALSVCSLYRELISWRDLCALFQVCSVSEAATHHSAQSRLLHIWSRSFRVTCLHTQRHAYAHANVCIEANISIHLCRVAWYLNTYALCRHNFEYGQHWNVKRLYAFSAPHTHTHTSTQVLSCISCDIRAILHLAKVTTSSADPALQLRDSCTASGSTSPRTPSTHSNYTLSISTYEGFNFVAWRSKILLSYRSVFSLLFPVVHNMVSWSALHHCFIRLYLQCFGIESL